jgi:multidrug efflux pump subunit AcrB
MMEQLVKRRLIIGLAVLLVLSMGLITLYQLPRREIPVIQHPIATVDTLYPGASAGQVETYITDRLEASFTEIPGIKEVTSVSQAGFSQITITVEDNKNQEQVWNKVQQKINRIKTEFPDGAGTPSLHTDLQMQGVAIYQLVAEQEEELLFLEDWIDSWETAFRQVPGVVRVEIQGLSQRELRLRANPQKLTALGLSPAQLITIIQKEIHPAPPGQWNLEEKIYRLHFPAPDPDQLLQIPLGTDSTGHTIYLKDVATLEKAYPQDREMVTYEGKPSVSLSFFASNEKDLLKIDRQLRDLVQAMERELPEEIELVQVYSQADPIQRMFHDLGISFILAMLLVLLITSAGLNAFASIGAGLSVPLAFCGGILVLPWAGVDMNQITLIAFILVLGDLVDNAIVVNENIARHMAGGMLHQEAIRAGTGEVAPSIVSSTLIITSTFFPLLFLSGSSGDFIRPLPVVIISCIVASAIAALVFIPVYRLRFDRYLQNREAHFQSGWLHKQLEQAGDFYSRKIVGRLLQAPLKYAAGGLLISLLAFGLVKVIPVEFFPDVEREELFVEIEFHPSTAQTGGQEKMARIREFIGGQKGVRQVNTYYGTAMPKIFGMSTSSASGPDSGQILVFVDSRQASARQVRDVLSQRLGEAFPRERFSLSVVESGPPLGAPLAFRIKGDSLEELQGASDELRQAFLSQPGVLSVKDDLGQAIPRIVFQPLPAAMVFHEVQAGQISQALRLYGEGIDLGEVREGNDLIDLRLQYGRELKGISRPDHCSHLILSITAPSLLRLKIFRNLDFMCIYRFAGPSVLFVPIARCLMIKKMPGDTGMP